jgi:hypothetical protein
VVDLLDLGGGLAVRGPVPAAGVVEQVAHRDRGEAGVARGTRGLRQVGDERERLVVE